MGKKIARKGKGFSLSLVPRSTKGLFTGCSQNKIRTKLIKAKELLNMFLVAKSYYYNIVVS